MQISTGVGLTLGIVQLVLYFSYCDKRILNKKTFAVEESQKNMDNDVKPYDESIHECPYVKV